MQLLAYPWNFSHGYCYCFLLPGSGQLEPAELVTLQLMFRNEFTKSGRKDYQQYLIIIFLLIVTWLTCFMSSVMCQGKRNDALYSITILKWGKITTGTEELDCLQSEPTNLNDFFICIYSYHSYPQRTGDRFFLNRKYPRSQIYTLKQTDHCR